MNDTNLTLGDRLTQVLRHLGISRAHIAGCMFADLGDLLTAHPETVASLTLIGFPPFDVDTVKPLGSRLLLIHGDQGPIGSLLSDLSPQLPEAAKVTLPQYAVLSWSDFIRDHSKRIGTAVSAFLERMSQESSPDEIPLSSGEGEVAGITYRVEGNGPPIVLLPLMLAPSQWESLIPRLSPHYCTVTLGGAHLGAIPWMEERAGSPSYIGMAHSLVDAARLRPGDSLLEVGCGSGAVLRRVAQYLGGANPVTGVDINRYLLREAAELIRRDGLETHIRLEEGNAEDLPFPDNSFDLVFSATVMEEVNADNMMNELLRVTKPGGKVAAIVRAADIPFWVNVPASAELKSKVATFPIGASSGEGGCEDASLYRRFRQAGLSEIRMEPQFASFGPGQILYGGVVPTILNRLSPEEAENYRSAIRQAKAEGTLLASWPHHTAIGTKP